MRPRCLLVSVLVHPEQVRAFTLSEWDLTIRQGRAAFLLGRLYVLFESRGMLDAVPEQPRRHLEGAWIVATRQSAAVLHEVANIRKALAGIQVPLVFLKGAAYVLANLPVAKGRTLSDIDLLVPKQRLPDVEAALMLAGWHTSHPDAYDQRYYRQWMHEIPPMQHMQRGATIDVHHAILPETARTQVDSRKMRADAVASVLAPGVSVFGAADMVLHSAAHLFHEGELDKGLRDLVDLDGLLRHFSRDHPAFWGALGRRAREVGLGRSLFYALRYTTRMLGTPVPADEVSAIADCGPSLAIRPLMDALYTRALLPRHRTCAVWLTPLARWLLYVRGHWLRMPAGLLIYHLARKSLVRNKEESLAPPMISP